MLDPGALAAGLQPRFGLIGLPVAEVEAHAHHCLGGLALAQHGAVDQVGEPLGAHPAAVGQAQAEEDPVEDVALARAIGPCHHSETLVQRDRQGSAEGLEVGKPDLIDVNQQARAPSEANVAAVLTISRVLPTLRTHCVPAPPTP